MKGLLVLGADPKIKDTDNKTPLDYADKSLDTYDEIEELFKLFKRKDSGRFRFLLFVVVVGSSCGGGVWVVKTFGYRVRIVRINTVKKSENRRKIIILLEIP